MSAQKKSEAEETKQAALGPQSLSNGLTRPYKGGERLRTAGRERRRD